MFDNKSYASVSYLIEIIQNTVKNSITNGEKYFRTVAPQVPLASPV